MSSNIDIKDILKKADDMKIKRIKDKRGMVVKNNKGGYDEYVGGSIFDNDNKVKDINKENEK